MPPLLNNGIDLRKRRLTIEAESGSLTDRKPHHDEKGGGLDLGALAKELAVQVDDLKNEGKRIEQENEAKRMEWVWLDLVRHSLLPPSMTLFSGVKLTVSSPRLHARTHAFAGTGKAGRGEPEAEGRERGPAPTRQVQVQEGQGQG